MVGISYQSLSPAGQLFAAGEYGGSLLQEQTKDEAEELRKKRMQRSQGYSPAGQIAAIDFGMMSVPGAQ